MIEKSTLFEVGEINKTHGVSGEMSFISKLDTEDFIELDCFFIERDGIVVPFYIESMRRKTASSGLIKFVGINSDDEAREFVGAALFVHESFIINSNDDEFSLDFFIGFSITDSDAGFTGLIVDIDESTDNALLIVESNDEEFLIPASESYMLNIDMERKCIECSLPSGLLGL